MTSKQRSQVGIWYFGKINRVPFCPVVTFLCVGYRYRSITKQFFRKADGVVVMYDVTFLDSFKAVRPWLINVQVSSHLAFGQTGHNK